MPELWLKDHKVMAFKEQNGAAVSINNIVDRQLLPVPLMLNPTVESFNSWLARRTIPDRREGLDEVKKRFGDNWMKSQNRLSLTDQYYIKYRFEEWRKINFFSHEYSTNIGDMFFHPWTLTNLHKINNNTPDITTNGMLKKRWIQFPKKGTESYLVKAGSSQTQQEPLSEILVSVFLEQIKIIPFVRYDYHVEGTTLCSISKNFVTANTELVPLSDFYHFEERDDEKESINSHILRMCDKVFGGVPGMEEYLDAMNFIDLVTGQEDRNLSNIAILRDSNTMKPIGPAPLFDFGAAYWSDGKIERNIRTKKFIRTKNAVLKRIGKKVDLEKAFKDKRFHECIETYPLITDEKKRELIKNIDMRNNELLRAIGPENELDRSLVP